MPVSIRVGDRLGSYRIVRSIGEGGMGVVYEAVHEQIGRRAAAKVLSLDARQHPGLFQRFMNEARAATQIDHPGVVQVFEFGQLSDGTPWMLMEFLQGTTLSSYLRAARKATGAPLGTDGLWILHDLAAILARAHSKGIVHRDLKPSNAMIVEEPGHGERVKLLDFGIAKFLSDSLGEESANQHRTRTGALLGTPAYMAPEQCKTLASIDGQADVYALGVMLFELYTAQQPFFDAEPLALMMRKLTDPAPPLRELAPQAPEEIAELTGAMLRLEPRQRPTMVDVQRQLAAFLRLPAARRSGFVPQVTPPERRPEPVPMEPSAPSLPSTQSGPLPQAESQLHRVAAPGDPTPESARAPNSDPAPPMPTGAALIPPTPPEYSSGQLARQAVSIGQQPTRQQSFKPRMLRGLLALAGVSVLTTAALFLWPRPESVSKSTQPASGSAVVPAPAPPVSSARTEPPAAASVALAEKASTTSLAATTNESAAAPTKRSSKPRCVPIPLTASCISNAALALQRKYVVVQELTKLNVRLCPGESIHLRHRPGRIEVLEAPGSMSASKREQISFSLLGALGQQAQQQRLGDLFIRCAAP